MGTSRIFLINISSAESLREFVVKYVNLINNARVESSL